MLNLDICCYSEYFGSAELDAIELASAIYDKEQFEILWSYLELVYGYVLKETGKVDDKVHAINFMTLIITNMRVKRERYDKFLDYLVSAEIENATELDKIKPSHIKNNLSDVIHTRETVEIDFLKRYKIIFSIVA
jgi:hypothetical protein